LGGAVSFEVFLQCFEKGEPAGVPRDAIRPLFPVVEAESEPDYWCVRYDELNSCRISVTSLSSDTALVESLCVFRPCADMRLWDALTEVMRLGPVVLYFPGDAPPLVASEAASEQLPPEMIESLGRPRVVRSGQEIAEAIKHA
jgi:hypothetical protein